MHSDCQSRVYSEMPCPLLSRETGYSRGAAGAAARFGGHVEEPRLRWKFAWLRPILEFEAARRAQMVLPQTKT